MNAPDLKPIPVPPIERFRQFKMTFLPSLIFGGALVILGVLWQDRMGAPKMVGQGDGTQTKVNPHQSGGQAGFPVMQFQKVHPGGSLTNVLIANTKLAEVEHALPVNLRLPTALQLCPDELPDGSITPSTQ